MTPLRLFVALLAVLLGLPAAAAADMTKEQCIDTNTNGQNLRREGKLALAGEQFRACAAVSCPGILREDCTRRLDEVEDAQPSVIFDAKDASGRDLSSVKVRLDGQPFAERLDGTALQVDPGEHIFTFALAGVTPVTQTFVIKLGEKRRRERILIAGLPSPKPSPTFETRSRAPVDSDGSRTRKIAGLVVGGVGLAGVAVGSVFGAMTFSATSQQQTDCAAPRNCTDPKKALTDHDNAITYGTIATASMIAGGALIVTGAILVLTTGHPSEPTGSARLAVTPSLGLAGPALFLEGRF
jgi:hypothetical protein